MEASQFGRSPAVSRKGRAQERAIMGREIRHKKEGPMFRRARILFPPKRDQVGDPKPGTVY